MKKTIVGAGHCEKEQIRLMLRVLLPKADPPTHDAADALAIAVYHAHHRQSAALKLKDGGAMIGKLKGIIDSYGEDFIVLDVQGVGYLVHCSARTLQALPAPGEAATLSIETHVREDQIRLFGFLSDAEREWFRLLQTVQGVGAKVALSVLGTFKPGDLASAIAMGDKAAIRRAPGVGPKVAERIVIELKDKAPAYSDLDPAVIRLSGALSEKRAPQPVLDAVSALVNLGYGQPQAAAAIAAASRSAGEGAETAQLIRLGLEGAVQVTRAERRRSRAGRGRIRGDPPALSLRLAGGRRGAADALRQGFHRRQSRCLSRPHGGLRGGRRARPGHHQSPAKPASIPSSRCGIRRPRRRIGAIAVVSPCGACRELIWDYDRNARVIVPGRDGPETVGHRRTAFRTSTAASEEPRA